MILIFLALNTYNKVVKNIFCLKKKKNGSSLELTNWLEVVLARNLVKLLLIRHNPASWQTENAINAQYLFIRQLVFSGQMVSDCVCMWSLYGAGFLNLISISMNSEAPKLSIAQCF